jgi:GH15 family glucan-1,4-alpha-glucosidase
MTASSLDLAIIGNGTVSALIAPSSEIVWACFPRFDGDPMFCALLQGERRAGDAGSFQITLVDQVAAEQEYVLNSAVLVTRLYDRNGSAVEITDFAPRFERHGRVFCPMMLVRTVRRLAGNPRIVVRLRPAHDYGAAPTEHTRGSNHVRYVGGPVVLRLTTDAAITAILEETPFFLDDTVHLLLGPDETVRGSVAEACRHFLEETVGYWRLWVRHLAIPFEWQDAVIRAAITLELNAFEDTGAIVAAMTTSIPEAPDSGRNWDYRYCWLRDAYFVVDALNRLGATRTMERYLAYILNVVATSEHAVLQPLYGISGQRVIAERTIDSLPGYRGMGPVRVGNEAYRQVQHDAYGSAILAATHVFFDRRLVRGNDDLLFQQLELLGEQAAALFDQPDAGIWELRGAVRVHTFTSVVCWAGCDRLARIATHIRRADRAAYWRAHADRLRGVIEQRSWNADLGTFTATMEGDGLDASLLLLHEVGFLPANDPRFAGTVAAVERSLKRGAFIYRYADADDFGVPQTAFLICTFWYIDALAALGRHDEARALFESVLACRNRHGLLAEDIDPVTYEQWGNFVQTYSMVGLISAAARLSISWDHAF